MQREPTGVRLGSDSLLESQIKLKEKDCAAMVDNSKFAPIPDRFEKLSEVRKEIKKFVDAEIGLIFGIDYTLSNFKQGQRTFGGKSLHAVSGDIVNPYQEGECKGFGEVLEVYNSITKNIKLGHPTNFAPLIRKAISIVKETKQFHVLIIVADGQVNEEEDTVAAIVEASNYPLSIVVIGVGDGPWEEMKEFDDNLPERRFDNFQFVDFYETKTSARNPETAVALAALMEIPDQFKAIKQLGLYENCL